MSSPSLHVDGIKPADDQYRRMEAVYLACNAAKVPIPTAVDLYFNDMPPSGKGVVVPLDNHGAVSLYSAEMIDGFDVDLKTLPKDIKTLRFRVCY